MPAASRFVIRLAFLLILSATAPAVWAAKPTPVAAQPPPLQPLLAGEFALQAGKLDEASASYLAAARAARDVALAERATQIALVGKNDGRAREALALWRLLAGNDAAAASGIAVAEATLALHAGDLAAATRSLTGLLKQPGDDGWRHALGAIAGGATSAKQAADVLERLLDAGSLPNTLQAWLAFGGLAQRLDRPQLAERIVAEVVRRFPGDPRVALLHASQLRDAGKRDQARALIDTLRDAATADADLRVAVAQEYDALGDSRAAAATLARGPQDDQSYALRAALLAKAEDTASLQSLYDELARDAVRPDPQRRLLLGQVAEFLKKYDAALGWYASVPGGAQRWAARLRSASVVHELGRHAEAFDQLRALEQDGAAEDDVRRDAYLLEAGLWQKDHDDVRQADAFARGLGAFPDEPDLLYARALAWERRDDIARAEADFRKILVVQPENVAALNALGYTLADRTDRYREALALIDRARAAEPTNGAIVDSYGWVLYRLGRPADALTELQRAYALQKDPEIAAHVGEVLWALGRRVEALRYFDEARKLDPESRALQRALQKTGARLVPAAAAPIAVPATSIAPVPTAARRAPAAAKPASAMPATAPASKSARAAPGKPASEARP